MAGGEDGRRTRYEHRRGELLHAVTEYALDHGIADLTLRKVAAVVGVSHATLVHHFATRDDLVVEIVDHVLTRALLPDPQDVAAGFTLRAAWDYARTGDGARYARLFVSIVGLALYGDPPFAEALRRSMRRRTQALADGLVLLGCPPDEALGTATTLLARLRGLAVDLMLTGDGDRVDAGFDVLVEEAAARRAGWERR